MVIIEIVQSIIQTEAFRHWFGDSKVVDQHGKPLILYRGLHGPYIDSVDRMEGRSIYIGH